MSTRGEILRRRLIKESFTLVTSVENVVPDPRS